MSADSPVTAGVVTVQMVQEQPPPLGDSANAKCRIDEADLKLAISAKDKLNG